jgi:5,5'-dehydrodivanillate O-demethylase
VKHSAGLSLYKEHCPHRGASLAYGYIEDDCLRCAYHGWKFNADGVCVEKPFEVTQSNHQLLPSYPVLEYCGLLFTYLGPTSERPIFPKWDILTRNDGLHTIEQQADLNCNWLQVQENAADVTHTYYLHAKMFERLGMHDATGFNRPMKSFGFQPFRWGIIKTWTYHDGLSGWGNLLVFPNILRLMTEIHWRVPVDDVTTRIFWLGINFAEVPSDTPVVLRQPDRNHKDGSYKMDTFMSQDAMAVETQGVIFDRSRERLGASDRGIVMFRKMLKEQIENVSRGSRPIANLYSSTENSEQIDLRRWMGGFIPMSCLPDPTFNETVSLKDFKDERYVEFQLPNR